MGCQLILRSWTLCALAGAFLDLAITFYLLCCSTVAYFIAKFLALFGLTLPCPCNGLFGYIKGGPCLQQLLVDYPVETVSNLQLTVKSKFPFDAILGKTDRSQVNLKLTKERKLGDGEQEYDDESPYSSFSDPRRSQQSFSGDDSIKDFNPKGKGVASQKQRSSGLRRRRRGSVDSGKFTQSSCFNHTRAVVRDTLRSPSGPDELGSTVSEFGFNDGTDEGKFMYNKANRPERLEGTIRHGDGVNGVDESIVRILEQALEEERAAREAMYSELEQERIAAATAADEAMAMISRLQEEKAAIEMEARQYQRIFEEKSSYDAEEMDILKEIIVRREREKHFLEREVETYQKLLQEDEGSVSQDTDALIQNYSSPLDSSANAMDILQQLSESIDRRGYTQSKSDVPDYASSSADKETSAVSARKEFVTSQWNHETKIAKKLENPECSGDIPDHLENTEESNQEIQEKVMLSIEDIHYSQFSKEGRVDDVYPPHKMNLGDTDGGKQIFTQVGQPQVHDVHIIGSEYDVRTNMARKGCGSPDDSRVVTKNSDTSFDASKELEINRSRSDIVDRFMSERTSARRTVSELRRNSLPPMDHERLKIDSEVEWLRMKLRAVQEEKERLKTSLEPQERGKAELQLLEDIASQIREIRQLTQPEKTGRQGGLPPLSSMTSKRRRTRSVTVGIASQSS